MMQRKFFKTFIVILLSCIAIVGAIWVHAVFAGSANYSEEAAVIRNLNTFCSYEGNLEAAETQAIYATSSSTMKRLYVTEGDIVKKGDLLYELEGDLIESHLAQAQASTDLAEIALRDSETNLQHIIALYEEDAVSRSEYESALSSREAAAAHLASAQAELGLAEKDAKDLKKYAEIDGEVAGVNVKDHDTMPSGFAIMEVINYDRLIVKIKIDEFDLDSVSEGDPAEVFITALNKTVSGTVNRISKTAEVNNGVSYFEAEVAITSDTGLNVGLSSEIRIQGQHAENVVSISMNALQFDASDYPCVLMRSNSRTPVLNPVTVGINDGIYVEIKDGLQAGDVVLLPHSEQSQSVLKLPIPGRRFAASSVQ